MIVTDREFDRHYEQMREQVPAPWDFEEDMIPFLRSNNFDAVMDLLIPRLTASLETAECPPYLAEQFAEAVAADFRQKIPRAHAADGCDAPRFAEKDNVFILRHAQNAPVRIKNDVFLLPTQGAKACAIRIDEHELGHFRHIRRLPDQRGIQLARVRRIAFLNRRANPRVLRQRVRNMTASA